MQIFQKRILNDDKFVIYSAHVEMVLSMRLCEILLEPSLLANMFKVKKFFKNIFIQVS